MTTEAGPSAIGYGFPCSRFDSDAAYGREPARLNDDWTLSRIISPSALSRLDRDVIVMEGINDLGEPDLAVEHPQSVHDALVTQLETSLVQIAARAHEHGLRVYGATLDAI